MICIEHCKSQIKGDNILQFNVFCRQEVHGEQEGNTAHYIKFHDSKVLH